MKYVSGPYFEPDFDPVLDRFGTPGVVVDNETREDCTLVKVDSVNRDGVLLEMVQLLTDLDLVISKSYISSDGGWLMDVFHVTDQTGRKLTDPSLPGFIERALAPLHRAGHGPSPPRFTTCLGNVVGPCGPDVSDCAALEFAARDRPGLLSSVTSVLVEHGCHVASGQAWTHHGRAAGVLYVTAGEALRASRWARVQGEVDAVVGVRAGKPATEDGGRPWVRVTEPVRGRVHAERRIHQMMQDDGDFECGPAPAPVDEGLFAMGEKVETAARTARRADTRVSIESWEERGYAVVKMTSRDRPRLLFDTVCALTDMHYVVFHATVGSQGPLAIQEYYIRHKDGRTVDTHAERQKISRSLRSAVERRSTRGLKVELRASDRSGLLSDFAIALREHGLSMLRIELKRYKDEAVGIFYLITDAGGEVTPEAARALQATLKARGMTLDVVQDAPGWPPVRKTSVPAPPVAEQAAQARPRRSLGSLLMSHLGKLSNNFGHINS